MFFCNDCGANFETQKLLDYHVKIAHDDCERTCTVCKKKVVGLKTLFNHMRNHKDTRYKWC